MIKVGEYQTLTIDREMPQGFYLTDAEDEEEVLLPRSFITEEMEVGKTIDVFVYCDSEERDIATTEKPLITVGKFASLRVNSVNEFGAFCGWGVPKELLIPFSNQAKKLYPGEDCIVYMYLDELSDRLVGTTKLRPFLKSTAEDNFVLGQEVDLLVYEETDIGYRVLILPHFNGLVYKNEVNGELEIGKALKGYIKPLRDDGKIDVSLNPIGHKSIGKNEKIIMDALNENNGFLPFTDKSAPDAIRERFGISKKLFKKILGSLYKQRLITLEDKGVRIFIFSILRLFTANILKLNLS